MSADDMIDTYLSYLILAGKSDYTVRNWRKTLCSADRSLPSGLDWASEAELLRWLGQPGWAAATKYTYYLTLDLFYRWATRDDDRWLHTHPMRNIPRPPRPPGVPNPCSDDQLEHILTHAREPYRTWAIIAAYTSARCIEIGRLDREDIGPDTVRLHGKGGKWRAVPTHPLVWDLAQTLPSGPVATGRWGQRLDGNGVSRNAVRYFHRYLRMPDMGLHRLRHWCLTRVQESTGDIRVTQEVAGHSSPATTAMYTRVSDSRRTAAVRALPTVGRGPSGEVPALPG